MKTVTAICVYDSTKTNKVYNLSFVHGENIIPMIYGTNDTPRPTFNYFIDLHNMILKTAKQNNMQVKHTEEFSGTLYDIKYIDISRPGMISRYYTENAKTIKNKRG